MKKLYVFLIIVLLSVVFNFGQMEDESNWDYDEMILHDSSVVSILSEPPDSDSAAQGTGIVVDKENGLILTARHGVYMGEILNYQNENLFKNILVTNKDSTIELHGYVAHLSVNHDLAIIKVDHQFPTQAAFGSSDFMKIRDEIEFWGYPDGQYGTYRGYIANTKEKYLNLDMTIVEGMSGGPIVFPGKGVVGIVMLRQKIGGNALRVEIVKEYLQRALPWARAFKKKSYTLCLKKIRFNESQTSYNKEDEPDLYFRLSVNGKDILETETVEVTGSEMQWNDCINNKFQITLIPGDKIEFKVLRSKIYSFLKETVLIEKLFQQLPQKGLLNLEPEVVIDDNTFVFEKFE